MSLDGYTTYKIEGFNEELLGWNNKSYEEQLEILRKLGNSGNETDLEAFIKLRTNMENISNRLHLINELLDEVTDLKLLNEFKAELLSISKKLSLEGSNRAIMDQIDKLKIQMNLNELIEKNNDISKKYYSEMIKKIMDKNWDIRKLNDYERSALGELFKDKKYLEEVLGENARVKELQLNLKLLPQKGIKSIWRGLELDFTKEEWSQLDITEKQRLYIILEDPEKFWFQFNGPDYMDRGNPERVFDGIFRIPGVHRYTFKNFEVLLQDPLLSDKARNRIFNHYFKSLSKSEIKSDTILFFQILEKSKVKLISSMFLDSEALFKKHQNLILEHAPNLHADLVRRFPYFNPDNATGIRSFRENIIRCLNR